jgi:3-methyladenine DNA glycosylase/8-oxoguanine DNA glycosylase
LQLTHPRLRQLQRELAGLRIVATHRVMEALVPAILEQKITSHEAHKSFRMMVHALGEPAPGPMRLKVAPEPSVLAAQPYWVFHRFGIERKRADVIRAVSARADRLEECVDLSQDEAFARLTHFTGIGPWTAAEVAARAMGDPDAVSVGDFHLPHLVAWVMAGEERATDERMLELLEPYRGERGRVIRLIESGAGRRPRRAPRQRIRSIQAI